MSELLVLGSVNMDLVIRTPRLPIPGETVLGGVLQTFPGGKGANQSVSAAKLGASTRFLGCVGDDEFGGNLRENLLRAGVNCELLRTRAGMNSGVAFIEVDAISGENHIIVAPGANGTISPDDVHASADLLARMDALVCQLEIPMETVETAFSLASELGVLTVLNAAPMRPLSDDLLGRVDYLIVNESELAALSGMATDSESSVREAAEVLLKRGPKAVVVTLGRNGTFFTQGARRGMVPAFKVEAVDAVGAGDAFVGAFTVAITEGMDIAEAARFGNAAGAVAVTRQGAQASQPTRKEVEALLSNA